MKFRLPFRPAAGSAAAADPPGIFKLAVYAVEYALFRGAAAFFRHLPRPHALATGRALGGLAEKVMVKQRKTAQDNLRQAFPERSDQQIRQDVRAVFQHLGISAVELLRVDLFHGKEDVERYFSFTGWEHVKEAYGLRRGVLVMTGHMGYWESGGFLFPQFGFPLDVVARRVKNPWVDRFITRLREAYGGQVLDSHKGARKILRSLAEGRGVAVLLDQHTARKEAVPVTFFGRQAWTTPIIAKIAMRQQIPILPVYSWRTPDFRYEVRVEPPIMLKNEPGEEAIRRNTELLTASIEQAVRHNPIQWFWVHRRWRSY